MPESDVPTAQPSGASPDAAPAPPPTPHTLALVQYFAPGSPRSLQRGKRPYTYTAKAPEDGAAAPRSFRLKIAGRVAKFADGQPIHCVAVPAGQPPVCAVSVEFTTVALEDAATGERLSDWER